MRVRHLLKMYDYDMYLDYIAGRLRCQSCGRPIRVATAIGEIRDVDGRIVVVCCRVPCISYARRIGGRILVLGTVCRRRDVIIAPS